MSFYCEYEHATRPQLTAAKPAQFVYNDDLPKKPTESAVSAMLKKLAHPGVPIILDVEVEQYVCGLDKPIENLDRLAELLRLIKAASADPLGIYLALPGMGGRIDTADRWQSWHLWNRLMREVVAPLVDIAVVDNYIWTERLNSRDTMLPAVMSNALALRGIYASAELAICLNPYKQDKQPIDSVLWAWMIEAVRGMGATPVLWLGGWAKRAFGEDANYPGESLPAEYFKALA